MTATSTQEAWQSEKRDFREQLKEANRREFELDETCEAHLLRAKAYYSRYSSLLKRNPLLALLCFARARKYALSASVHIKNISRDKGWGAIAADQYDLVATIMLRSWLLMKPDPELALEFFRKAYSQRAEMPVHVRATIEMGMAEAYYLVDNICECLRSMSQALGVEKRIAEDLDQAQAHRQYCHVLRRAAALRYKMDAFAQALNLHQKALTYARDPCYGSADQVSEIEMGWWILRLPAFVQACLPY